MAKRFLLVGWEAADWKLLNPLLDAGEMPALNRLVEAGVAGDLNSTQPLDAAAQWTSMVTAKRPWRHGITHSREFAPAKNQFHVITRQRRCTDALWEMLARKSLRSMVVGWPATHGSQVPGATIVSDRYSEPTAGPGVKPWPRAADGTYWPPELGLKLDALRASPELIGADVISKYIPDWQKIDQQHDHRIGHLRVLLTSDFSHFAAAASLLESEAWDFAAVRFSALGHIFRMFAPFTSPRRPWINESEFDLYHAVVKTHCRMLDQFLARLQQLAGPDTTVMVLSAHGTIQPDFPPAGFPQTHPESWKSSVGALVFSGPGLVRDGLLHGASVLDVTPTILTWFGLPIAEDMEGRVLVEAFEAMPAIARISTWEAQPKTELINAATSLPDSPTAQALHQESTWNYLQSCLEAGQLESALPKISQLFREFPERTEYAHALFQCQINLKQLQPASETLEVLLETVPPGVFALLPQAELAIAKRDVPLTRKLVNDAIQLKPTHPTALRRIGLLLLRLRDWVALAKLAQEVLVHDESDPIVWLGLAQASLRLQNPAAAENAARRAIQLKYFLPDAHFVLARSLVAQNKWNEARECMSALVKLQPDSKSVAGYNRRLATNPSSDADR